MKYILCLFFFQTKCDIDKNDFLEFDESVLTDLVPLDITPSLLLSDIFERIDTFEILVATGGFIMDAADAVLSLRVDFKSFNSNASTSLDFDWLFSSLPSTGRNLTKFALFAKVDTKVDDLNLGDSFEKEEFPVLMMSLAV